jgi:hypothetical protein
VLREVLFIADQLLRNGGRVRELLFLTSEGPSSALLGPFPDAEHS